jgi:hypothetical protein
MKKLKNLMQICQNFIKVCICYILCICDVGYINPSFVINVVNLDFFLNIKIWHYFKNIFHPFFFIPNEMEKLLQNYVDA